MSLVMEREQRRTVQGRLGELETGEGIGDLHFHRNKMDHSYNGSYNCARFMFLDL